MEYRERALAMIEKKVEGQEIKAVAPAPRRSRPGRQHLRSIEEQRHLKARFEKEN